MVLLSALLCAGAVMAAAPVVAAAAEGERAPVAYRVEAGLPDALVELSPSAVRVGGWLGARVEANAQGRMLHIDTEPLLAGYREKPGTHPWIGEHVGKWLHAATLAWANTGNPALRAKLDDVAGQLIASQEADGYLGTYVPEKRFGLYPGADWDVWSHKYNLIGLLTYYRYTGQEPALEACRKAADLLIATFPSERSLIEAGTHVGMAATSVLEPVVLLYRQTGEAKYLEFARYVVRAYDEPQGPAIVASLLRERRVDRVANAKAYEMLSNLVGLCELARATGERAYLEAPLIAWADIVAKRLYPTGSASAGELFRDDHELPGGVGAHIGEVCVTTTWIQLNLQLLRLTGEAKYGDELERSFYNHLTAAQHPAGEDWCYYTALEGKKQYDAGITCCHSSGPRGLALVPQASYLKGRDAASGHDVLVVNTVETSGVSTTLGGSAVTVEQASGFPRAGGATLTVETAAGPATFGLRWRAPAWIEGPVVVRVNGQEQEVAAGGGWIEVESRAWETGDQVELGFEIPARVMEGSHSNEGRLAVAYGPFVLAYDAAETPEGPSPAAARLVVTPEARPSLLGGPAVRVGVLVMSKRQPEPVAAVLVPFADAGAGGSEYRVWLRDPDAPASDSILDEAEESRSRSGNVGGSITDGDRGSYVVTFDARRAEVDWYAVRLPEPTTIREVTFAHGTTFHDGGWFDTAAGGKPRVEYQKAGDSEAGDWRPLGALEDYPDTTATNPAGLRPGQAFTLRLAEPVEAAALRVVGVPASGDNPSQAFSSCGEIEAK